jgi:hypothetical protein
MKQLSKKELEQHGLEAAESLVESGEDVLPRYIEITRQIALLEAEKKGLKESAINERTLHGSGVVDLYGCKTSITKGADRIQYDKDPVIKERKLLVKAANNSTKPVFDSDGVLVEKVPVTHGGESLKLIL